MIPIKHLFHINSPVEKVFEALTNSDMLSNWYTSVVNGEFKLGETIIFEFVNFATFKVKVIYLV
jgi:uncharacterized protein YndB with AHSA1/START domain